MKLPREQFDRESGYRLALAVAKALLTKGLLTKDEYQKANDRFIEKYRPVWGQLPDVVRLPDVVHLPSAAC